jgi:hypothetical protein
MDCRRQQSDQGIVLDCVIRFQWGPAVLNLPLWRVFSVAGLAVYLVDFFDCIL